MKTKLTKFAASIPVITALFMGLGQAKTLQFYILTGQSNSLGAVKGSPASAELLKQYESNGSTKFWHTNFNKDSGKPVDVNPPPSDSWGAVTPQICGTEAAYYNCMGPEYGFASVMERKGWKLIPGSGKDPVDIGIVKASLDGGSKEYWNKGTPAYKTIIDTVKQATVNAKSAGYDKIQIAGVMYIQGESNSSPVKAGEDFLTFLNKLEGDIASSGADTSLLKKQQAILGEHALWGTINSADPETGDISAGDNGNAGKAGNTSEQHKALTESRKNMGWVPTRDLAKITKGDGMGVHYDGKSQITIGARFAYEAARLAGYNTGCVRNGDASYPLCSPNAWTNGRLPLKTPAIWDVASSAKDNMTGNTAKEKTALFGIKIEDTYLNTVTIRGIMEGNSPSLKDSSLTLGKGGITINQGKNLKIASVLTIVGNQTWRIAPGASILITSSNKSDSSIGTLLSGTGDLYLRSSQKSKDAHSDPGKLGIDLTSIPGVKPYTGNWTVSDGISLYINGNESSSPGIILGTLSLTLNNNKAPVLTVSGSNFIIRKGIILNISSDITPTKQISFQIINPKNNKLVQTLNKEKFFLSPQSKGWKIDSFDASSGILSLSPSGTP